MKWILSVCLVLMLSAASMAQTPGVSRPDSTKVGMNGKPTHYLPGFTFPSPRGQATLMRWAGAMRGPWRWEVKYEQGGKIYTDWIDDDTIDSLVKKTSMILLEFRDHIWDEAWANRNRSTSWRDKVI